MKRHKSAWTDSSFLLHFASNKVALRLGTGIIQSVTHSQVIFGGYLIGSPQLLFRWGFQSLSMVSLGFHIACWLTFLGETSQSGLARSCHLLRDGLISHSVTLLHSIGWNSPKLCPDLSGETVGFSLWEKPQNLPVSRASRMEGILVVI